MSDLNRSARAGDLAAVRRLVADGADVHAIGEHGFTALQAAALGSGSADASDMLDVLRALIAAGSPLEYTKPNDQRTALYLAAEFARTVAPVALLAEAGAKVDIYDGSDNHVIVNARTDVVKRYISQVTGRAVPEPPPPRPKPVKLKAAQWRAAKAQFDPVFAALEADGFIVLQDVGYTQSDGFSDCTQVYHDRNKPDIRGFCYYTRQDLNRAKRTSQLTLAFWGALEGKPEQMEAAGGAVVQAFRDAGYDVDWNGSGGMRPTVYLCSRDASASRAAP